MSESLPPEILEKVLGYLDYKSLTVCESVCKYWRAIACSDLLWKRHCADLWLIDACDSDGEGDLSHKDIFVSNFRNFGRYANCYRNIRTAWNKIEQFIQRNEVKLQLEPGLADRKIDELEQTMFNGTQLPDDLRCSLRMHEGEAFSMEIELPHWFAKSVLFGEAHVYDSHRAESLLSVSQLQSLTDIDITWLGQAGYCPITMSLCVLDNNLISTVKCVALSTNKHGLPPGSVLNLPCDPRAITELTEVRILASSFTEWLVTYSEELAAGYYPVYSGHIHAYRCDPKSVAHTRVGAANSIVTVRVGTVNIPEYSYLVSRKNFFGYNVQIEMNSDAEVSDECQLETRTWRIFDGDVEQRGVEDQPGVIGLHPRMYPDAKFNYSSCTLVRSDFGSMKGHFTFRKRRDGSLINVEVPEFRFGLPPVTKLTNQDAGQQQAEQTAAT